MADARHMKAAELRRLASLSNIPRVSEMMHQLAARVLSFEASAAVSAAPPSSPLTTAQSSAALPKPLEKVKTEKAAAFKQIPLPRNPVRSSLRIASAASFFSAPPARNNRNNRNNSSSRAIKREHKFWLQPKTKVMVTWKGQQYEATVRGRNSRSGLYDVNFDDGSTGW